MADILAHGFEEAHTLAERLYTLQKEAADAVMIEIRAHGITLGKLVTDVEVIKVQTSDLPELKRRIEVLENANAKKQGINMGVLLMISAGWSAIVLLASHYWK
jgi:translation initiation factor 1 (eIF-1/SUI1)